MDVALPFASCSVCHARSGLFLTSCAHLVCRQHALRDAHNKHDLEHSKTRCPQCQHSDVSLVSVDNRLPTEIRPFFTPFPSQVEQLFAAAQFQYCGMAETIQHQEELIQKLVEKVNKQKELLLIAKDKMSQITSLEQTIQRLERDNRRLQANSSLNSRSQTRNPLPPPTIDLTTDSLEEVPGLDHRKVVTKSFIDSVKQSSSQKAVNLNNYKYTNPSSDTNHREFTEFSRGRLAESTNILRDSPATRSNTNVANPSRLKPLLPTSSAPSTNRASRSSKGSDQNSFTSRGSDGYQVQQSLQQFNNLKPPVGGQQRITKNRAATAQLAQRLTAHMKVGALQNRSQSRLGVRPGSSFTNPNPLFTRKR